LNANAYSAEKSVFKYGLFRLCKFNVQNITLVFYTLQHVIDTTGVCVCYKGGLIRLIRVVNTPIFTVFYTVLAAALKLIQLS
tara:strand:- start:235 stop:480 length:246 start_codon:yes stop_codon:yes gene_type:complete